MKNITRLDFDELLDEFLNCFGYLICTQLGISTDQLKTPNKEIHYSMLSDFKNKRVNGFDVLPLYELSELLKKHLLVFEHLFQHTLNDIYQNALHSYIEVGYPMYGFDNKKLRNRINGVINIGKRYEENLYKKREILYRVLKEETRSKGKWKNINQAVRDVYPQLEQEFEIFDQQWIRGKMLELKDKIKKNKIELKKKEKFPFDEGRINFQKRGYESSINKFQAEYLKLETALKTGEIARTLGKTLAFHSDYQEESIINHLRACPELLLEIIQDL